VLIYTDSKDLINLIERHTAIEFENVRQKLAAGEHKIVLSFATIVEIAGPLLRVNARTNVMSFCNKIELLPHQFVNEGRIDILELKEAIDAISENREFQKDVITPFFDRFDLSIPVADLASTRFLLRYSIAETLFDLWTEDPDLIDGYEKHGLRLIKRFQADRQVINPPSLKTNFVRKIRDDLRFYGIPEPKQGAHQFAEWIYASPSRCPGMRLAYETYHQLRRNVTAGLSASHLVDLVRLNSLPYVDIFTLDSEMYTYVSQAIRALGWDRTNPRIGRSIDGAIDFL
jgi:hypothetical protein